MAFMEIARETFKWDDYLEARTTAERAFRQFYERQRYPKERLEEALQLFIISFFNQEIDERQFEWEDLHPGEELPEPAERDIDNLYLARVFSVLECTPEDEAICRSIGVTWDFEQLHMCCWFAGQVTNGAGHYSRNVVNFSARTTYNRLLNPFSLLWIDVAMGADEAVLRAAAEEMAGKKTYQEKCGVVRRHVPFDVIYDLYNAMMTDEEAK